MLRYRRLRISNLLRRLALRLPRKHVSFQPRALITPHGAPEGVVPTRPSKTRQSMTKQKNTQKDNYVCEEVNSTKAEQDESGTVGPSIEHRKDKLAKQYMTSKRKSQTKIRAFRPHAPAQVTESALVTAQLELQ